MKYRFKKGGRKGLPQSIRNKKLRLKGRDTLRKKSPLPEPIEAIRLDRDIERPRPFATLLLRIINSSKRILKQLRSELLAAAKAILRLLKKLVGAIASAIKKGLMRQEAKKIDSLPILMGAVLSSFLVCTITASYILLTLFIPYSKKYVPVQIPNLVGMKLEDIESAGETFNLIIEYENNPQVENERVISQNPAPGATRKIYESDGLCTILLKVSRYKPLTVPDGIIGSRLRDATLSLLCEGIAFTISEKYSDIEKGRVISCIPSESAALSQGQSVSLTISAGNKELYSSVPNIVGLTESEALTRIKSSSLVAGEVTYVRSDKRIGTVIFQSPSPYTTQGSGQSVSFTVSAGAEFSLPVVPDLYGLSIEEARQRLYDVGLTVAATYSISSGSKAKTVISQSPIAGTPITSSITSVILHISN